MSGDFVECVPLLPSQYENVWRFMETNHVAGFCTQLLRTFVMGGGVEVRGGSAKVCAAYREACARALDWMLCIGLVPVSHERLEDGQLVPVVPDRSLVRVFCRTLPSGRVDYSATLTTHMENPRDIAVRKTSREPPTANGRITSPLMRISDTEAFRHELYASAYKIEAQRSSNLILTQSRKTNAVDDMYLDNPGTDAALAVTAESRMRFLESQAHIQRVAHEMMSAGGMGSGPSGAQMAGWGDLSAEQARMHEVASQRLVPCEYYVSHDRDLVKHDLPQSKVGELQDWMQTADRRVLAAFEIPPAMYSRMQSDSRVDQVSPQQQELFNNNVKMLREEIQRMMNELFDIYEWARRKPGRKKKKRRGGGARRSAKGRREEEDEIRERDPMGGHWEELPPEKTESGAAERSRRRKVTAAAAGQRGERKRAKVDAKDSRMDYSSSSTSSYSSSSSSSDDSDGFASDWSDRSDLSGRGHHLGLGPADTSDLTLEGRGDAAVIDTAKPRGVGNEAKGDDAKGSVRVAGSTFVDLETVLLLHDRGFILPEDAARMVSGRLGIATTAAQIKLVKNTTAQQQQQQQQPATTGAKGPAEAQRQKEANPDSVPVRKEAQAPPSSKRAEEEKQPKKKKKKPAAEGAKAEGAEAEGAKAEGAKAEGSEAEGKKVKGDNEKDKKEDEKEDKKENSSDSEKDGAGAEGEAKEGKEEKKEEKKKEEEEEETEEEDEEDEQKKKKKKQKEKSTKDTESKKS